MDEKRTIVALFGLVTAGILGYLAFRFIAALTVAVFLYYSTRRFYKGMSHLRLPARVRAAVVLTFIAVPLLFLLIYTVLLLLTEIRQFVLEYEFVQEAAMQSGYLEGIEELPEPSLQGFIAAYQAGELDPVIDVVMENAAFLQSTITGFFLNLLIIVVVTYYLLIDGWRIRNWVLQFDEASILREYLETADRELEAVLFGNLLNVLAISLIAIATFMTYNLIVPAPAEVPFPALAGALTGIASLIPVIGMKIVYVPLALAAATPLVLQSQFGMLVYIVGFLALTLVVVDTIPDLILRPYLSGERTHVGLLMLAYIFGPVVLGFYGLFFAPIVLVLGLTFGEVAMPRLLGVSPEERLPADQRQLEEY